jgi:polyhydroxyalkanoate synthase
VYQDSENELTQEEAEDVVSGIRNLYQHLFGGGFADLSRTPSEVVYEDGSHCTVRRYEATTPTDSTMLPVLLVPPMAAPASCMDLQRDNSLAGFLLEQGRPTFIVDYGDVSTNVDQSLGLEHWIDSVLPQAIQEVSRESDRDRVHLVGWSLGGILSLFTHAAHPQLPIASITAVASPFDLSFQRLLDPVRLASKVTGGRVTTSMVRLIGGVPSKVNTLAFTFADPMRLVKKPAFVVRSRTNTQALAQLEAVDALMDQMEAYPGRSFAQIFHTFVRTNHLRDGRVTFRDGRSESLAKVTVPVLSVAGTADTIFAPPSAAHHVVELVPNAAWVRLKTAPGAHLGVLTGGSARNTTWQYLKDFLLDVESDAPMPVSDS